MRKSQQIIFWRNHRVVELRSKETGKVIGWYGCRIPKTAEDRIKEVKK